jgi:ankyrin repeat protein
MHHQKESIENTSDSLNKSLNTTSNNSFTSYKENTPPNKVLQFQNINTLKKLKEFQNITKKLPEKNSEITSKHNEMKKLGTIPNDDLIDDPQEAMIKFITDENISGIKHLINKGFNFNQALDQEGFTPIHLAAKLGKKKIIFLLCNEGADINVQDESEKWTPLILSSINGFYECVELLVQKKANTLLRSDDGLSALDYARIEYKQASSINAKSQFKKIICLLKKFHKKII